LELRALLESTQSRISAPDESRKTPYARPLVPHSNSNPIFGIAPHTNATFQNATSISHEVGEIQRGLRLLSQMLLRFITVL
jgi:hypothetical protein